LRVGNKSSPPVLDVATGLEVDAGMDELLLELDEDVVETLLLDVEDVGL